MKFLSKSANPFLTFAPFLLIYVGLVVTQHSDLMEGDEGRYYEFAQNLLNGFYSPPTPDINLWNGPGYPLLLTPFVFFDLPLLTITLLNAVFHYLSIVLLFLAVRQSVDSTKAYVVAIIWGGYFIAYKEMSYILTESLTTFLVSTLVFCFCRLSQGRKYQVLVGAAFGFLVLTKIVFGYVLLAVLLFAVAFYVLDRSSFWKKVVVSCLLALLLNLPYLFYTYSLTGKVFYWGNSGGMSLYWMSTPFPHEFGDWNSAEFDAYCFEPLIPCNAAFFAKNHQADIDYIMSLPAIERDDAYKKLAVNNIKNYPLKFVKNCLANVARLFFNYPESYTFPREMNILRLFPNAILFTFMVLTFLITLYNWKRLDPMIISLSFILFLYLGASTLVSATARHLNVVVPLILFWIIYSFHSFVTIKWVKPNDAQ